MDIIVQKFGGSSLRTEDLRQRVVDHIVGAVQRGMHPVVVVSAVGRYPEPYATDTLLDVLKATNECPSLANADLLLSSGEVIASVITAETLNQTGNKSLALTGWQAGIVTDNHFGDARILTISPTKIRRLLEDGIIPVVAGFQGATAEGEVTTLGRGGSDTTAAALAVVLGATAVEIYTDVQGIKTADPRLVPEAPTLTSLTFREVMEMAHLGARVIHPRAVEIAMEGGVPLRILPTSGGQGTVVGPGRYVGGRVIDRVVTGIAHLEARAQVRIAGRQDFNRSRLALKIFDLMASAGISVDLIYLSPDLIAFVIDEAKVTIAREVLDKLELNISIVAGFAKVSVVGAGMHGVPGVMARVVGCMEGARVDIYQTTDSHANISCLIKETDLAAAVCALHREFGLDQDIDSDNAND